MVMNLIGAADVRPYQFGGWGLAFRVGEMFEEEANSLLCRAAADELVALLERHGPVELSLPPPRPMEIDVEAPLTWGGITYRFGFNTSDGAVSLGHPEPDTLDKLLRAVVDGLMRID